MITRADYVLTLSDDDIKKLIDDLESLDTYDRPALMWLLTQLLKTRRENSNSRSCPPQSAKAGS